MSRELTNISIEPVQAWRKWRVDADDGLLRSLFKDSVWIPRQKMTATCQPHAGVLHESRRSCSIAPQFGCHCGIWGVPAREDIPQIGEPLNLMRTRRMLKPGRLVVVGTVSLWGRIIKHERGWRAQFGYPYSLIVVPASISGDISMPQWRQAADVAAMLRENYLVDTQVDA